MDLLLKASPQVLTLDAAADRPHTNPPTSAPKSNLSSLLRLDTGLVLPRSGTPAADPLRDHSTPPPARGAGLPLVAAFRFKPDRSPRTRARDREIPIHDQYIPGLDYGRLVDDWNDAHGHRPSTGRRAVHLPLDGSREASYLDLDNLHLLVKPQPIALSFNKYLYLKLSEVMKLRTPSGFGLVDRLGPAAVDIQRRGGEPNYEAILNSLPDNFNELPYLQRKRLVTLFLESVDYLQFSLFAKNYLQDALVGLGPHRAFLALNLLGLNSSFARRSRAGSVNTIAGRLLRESTTDLKKLQEEPPKQDVDERGAVVMDHVLGRVIGLGAWGTIRECTDRHGTIRAIKVVRSERLARGLTARDSSLLLTEDTHNPRVLEVFRKEIEIWKQLHNDHILPLLKSKETPTAIFCITNRIYGGTLHDIFNEWGPYDTGVALTTGPVGFSVHDQRRRLQQTMGFLEQIVDAVGYMHGLGIVHGDLKLENLLYEGADSEHYKVILCDFGMARKFTPARRHLVKKSHPAAKPHPLAARHCLEPPGHPGSDSEDDSDDDGTLYIRLRLSQPPARKPFAGGDSFHTRKLLFATDDVQVGTAHGPAPQLVDLTPVLLQNPSTRHRRFSRIDDEAPPPQDEDDIPHSHIGLLPYAAPELLAPQPPPLGPLADIWALGVVTYALVVGRLPFSSHNEQLLRQMIKCGDYDDASLRKSCLTEWLFQTEDAAEADAALPHAGFRTHSVADIERDAQLAQIQCDWRDYLTLHQNEYSSLVDLVHGCLELGITRRWDLDALQSIVVH